MAKLNVTMVQKFVFESKPTLMQIETILGCSGVAAFVAIAISYNSNFAFLMLLPFMLAAFVLYIVTWRTKTFQLMQLHLLSGLSGLLMSLTCMCACLVVVPIDWSNVLKWFLIMLVADLSGIAYGFFRAMRYAYARSNFLPLVGTISASVISSGAAVGRAFSRGLDVDLLIVILVGFAVFSWAFSFFFIEIMRYHYAKALEKLT